MDNNHSMKSKDKANEHLFSKFDDVLFSLDSELNPVEANVTKYQVYRRLSEQYIASPKKFTDKLITIIEESVINTTLNMSNNSIINFEKISKELQRMCKNLENESMPEQLFFTTISSSPNKEMTKIITEDKPTEITINKRSELSSNTSKKIYRKTPKSIFKSQMKKMDDIIPLSPSKYNNMSFEYLEAYCENLFPDEKKDRASAQSVPDSALLSMHHFFTICEQQLASLDSSSNDIEVHLQKKNEDSIKEIQSKDVICHSYNKPENSACKNKNKNKTLKKMKSETYKVNLEPEYLHYTDELDKTLLLEIAEKRRRCLHTAKRMMEINSECDTMEVKKKSKADFKSTLDVSSDKPQDNIGTFLKVLISCKDYHNYLENQLPILNSSVSSKTSAMDADINKSNKNTVNIKLIPNKNKSFTNQQINSKSRRSKSYTENYKKVLARWNIDSINKEGKAEKVVDKQSLFVTPGKISAKDKHMQRVFFADVRTTKKQRSPLKTSMGHNKQLSNINCISRSRVRRKESLMTAKQVLQNKLSPKCVKSPQRKISKVNSTLTPSTKNSIRRNLSTLHKCGVDKNKENHC